MKKDEALRAILAEWFKLPESERSKEDSAVKFTFQIMKDRPDLTNFRDRGDRYQTIKGFLCRYLSRT